MSTYSDIPYLTRVSRGLVSGASDFSFAGINPALSGTEETLWDYTGRYVFLTADTQLYVSSSSASDTTQTVTVTGVNNAGAIVSRTATLNGQNQVALSGLIKDVHNATIITTTNPLGDVYIAESDTLTAGVPNTASKVKGKIIVGNNSTFNGIRVVPTGYTCEIHFAKFGSGKADEVDFKIRLSPPTYKSVLGVEVRVYEDYITSPITIPAQIPAGWGIELTGLATTGTPLGAGIIDCILRS